MLLLLSCAQPPAPEPLDPPGLVEIFVEPSAVELVTGSASNEPIQFSATGVYDDGLEEPLELVEWSLSNRSAGDLDEDGLFLPTEDNGGITWVTARLDGVEGSATVSLVYTDALVEDGVDPGLFDGEVSGEREFWLYPPDGVNLPRNTPSIRFMWQDQGASAYRLRFRSDVTDLSVYTASNNWTADVETWQRIVATNAGGSVEVQLEASIVGTVVQDTPRTLWVNRMDATGSIVYWSTTANGFKEIPYGGEATDFLTSNETGRCQGCHVISSRGDVAFTYDGGNGQMGIKEVSDLSDVTTDASLLGNFKAYSPDGEWLVSTYYGGLRLHDGLTGAYLGAIPLSSPVTMPSWSPDGGQLVVVTAASISSDWAFTGGSLATIGVTGPGTFGDVEVLYTPPAGENAYFPEFSPDGHWIVFNRSTGDSYDDVDATVWILGRDGGEPIGLVNANDVGQLTNSWPRWGPLPDDEVLWLTFSSKRAYGDLISGTPQIWVAAFDPERAKAGEDPSYAAFWLPGQSIDQNNHIPVWAP